MARIVKPLNDKEIKSAKAKDKEYTLADGNGLQLLIKPNGKKLWEFIYKSPITLKRRKTSFGNYPQTTLQTARIKRDEYSNLVRQGNDPLQEKKIKNKLQKKKLKKKTILLKRFHLNG